MKKGILPLLICICVNLSAQQIIPEDIAAGKYSEKQINQPVSSTDGEHYFQMNDGKSAIIKYAYKTASPIDTIFSTKRARECDFDTFEGFLISPDEKRLVIYRNKEQIYRHSFKADYYYYDTRRNLVRKLTENKSKQMSPVFSKDGRMLAYVADNNIWLAKFDYDTESQVTKDGQHGSIINGIPDWLYEEEFGVTCLMDFSNDSRLLAFVRFDETDVPEFSYQYYGNKLYPEFKTFKYPKAGRPNSKVSCEVFDIESKTIRPVNLPEETTEYIPRIEFIGDFQLAIMTLNREQNDFNMYSGNARSGVSRLILRETNERYISPELIPSIHFFNDEFVFLSQRDGYTHIYNYTNLGVLKKQLTSGVYDVTNILAVNQTTKTVFYESAEESPLRRSVYKTDAAKGTKTKLTSKTGYNVAYFGNHGKYFVNRFSDSKTPAIISIIDANGKELKTIETNNQLKEKASRLPAKEFITVKAKDGTDLNAWIMKPAEFNSSATYPLVMVQYGGPGSQQVLDKFSIDWTDYLVTQGFVVACVDGRGTGARGQEFEKCTYLNLGIKESDDQIEAAKYFADLPYIDSGRIGIWGWSYGGYNVLMSMSRGNIFKAGVAVAPVTDWHFYDTAYTERYMRTPRQNPSGYTESSPVALANNLSGNLLLIHGSADDNVHFQNSMEYANALINAGKLFDIFVLPDRNHSMKDEISRTYLYKKTVDFFKKNL